MMTDFLKSVQDLPFLYLTAAYAAVVSTLVLLWDVHKWREAKKKDKVELTLDVIFDVKNALEIIIKNTGKKTCTLIEFKVLTVVGAKIALSPSPREVEVPYRDSERWILNEGEILRAVVYNDENVYLNMLENGFVIQLIHSFSGGKPTRHVIVQGLDKAIQQHTFKVN